jgi:hypothetical protein
LWPVFNGHNDWEIVEIRPGVDTPDEEMEDVYATVLESIADVMASYRIEGDQMLTEYDPPIHVKNGELVCEGEYLEGLLRANGCKIKSVLETMQRKHGDNE